MTSYIEGYSTVVKKKKTAMNKMPMQSKTQLYLILSCILRCNCVELMTHDTSKSICLPAIIQLPCRQALV